MTRRSFGVVLDAALDASDRSSSSLRSGGIGTAGVFSAPFGPWWGGVSAFRSGTGSTVDVTLARPAEPPAMEPLLRPHSETERLAWRCLQDFGAGLPAAFTASHLKRAFRRLARQLHPDAHPTLCAATRADLCRDFAAAHDAYETLLAIGR